MNGTLRGWATSKNTETHTLNNISPDSPAKSMLKNPLKFDREYSTAHADVNMQATLSPLNISPPIGELDKEHE